MWRWLPPSFTLALGFGALAAISVTPLGKRGVFMGSVQLRVQSCPMAARVPGAWFQVVSTLAFHWEPPDLTEVGIAR